MRMTDKIMKNVNLILFSLVALIFFSAIAAADPVGPEITYITQSQRSSLLSSTLVNNASHTGGYIMTANLQSTQRDDRWKAYVGNLTGSLTLDDADNFSIYQWNLDTGTTGEVYATRSNDINWSNIVCASATNVTTEETAMNHTAGYAPNDRISVTFDDDANDHDQILVGASTINADSCAYSINLWVNDTAQAAGGAYFEEVLLWDGDDLIYAAIRENDYWGFRTGYTFDYQIMVPEKGDPAQMGNTVTPYYFYIDLG